MVSENGFVAIVPAAGVGSRMQADKPKQYLRIAQQTVLEHTVNKLLAHPQIKQVYIAIGANDPYFETLPLATHPAVTRVDGGKERADSVLSALEKVLSDGYDGMVLVHDAARPCVELADIDQLIEQGSMSPDGAILATPVRDTMKRGDSRQYISATVERCQLWHALTPQFFDAKLLYHALAGALAAKVNITDEASAIEWLGRAPRLVASSSANIKITQPEDLALAQFYLTHKGREE
ncbi:2-C-methyl-D-erythritol 4-phosphate cytidylyltransferase [Vibrio sp. SM6]|uniref:2-C-methyl-D-erythritol 4-phosphate cytidylyltransferase n=1 Tax=Vibrio agarilyticus TaxID=2726741 RepID=A0A7X8TQ17_9VIBR|nr:2-C-methyl-D-erythritol 4-phosphate cytidylyltransferase [Vibrio agarilyticus]NLS12830.1 2-C-methyl-D-erythritol 4-phosphate cytidylyltransferase [Vibrio agarilyticus]